ncbi:cytochrome P450 [Amycolatopsis sp. NPDC059027]|uniref:cytochrome P450 n=1 Tax=unclassified Amycolatopsis TaxID=2618356 RepID=UPI003672DFA4
MTSSDHRFEPRMTRPVAATRSAVAWVLKYGLAGLALRVGARQGDLLARSVVDPARRADPFPAYDEIRARGPLLPGRFVMGTASHAAANDILRGDRFLAAPAAAPTKSLDKLLDLVTDPRALGPVDPPSLLAISAPEHTRIRKLVAYAFTPRAITALTGRVQELADEMLDKIAAENTVDLIEAYASLLPVTVIAEILGVPEELRRPFVELVNEAALSLEPGLSYRDYRRATEAVRNGHRFLDEHIARLRRNPGDDLLSRMIEAADGSDRLTDTELRVTALLVLGAGFETTVNLIGNAVTLLLAHPDQLDRLKAEPDGWPNAVEEVLRYDSPVQVTLRVSKADTEVLGVPVREGQAVVVMLGGANRDPDVFTDPNRFDTTRANAREHLAFSAGPHFCLGAQLARLEGATALRTLFERFPNLALDGSPTRRGTRVLRGYRRLPVRVGA